MRTREVAEICGVTEECIRQNAKKVGMEFGYGEFTNHNWSEDELRKIQMQLMKNQTNQGTQVNVVKGQIQTGLELGVSLQEIIKSGNVAAIDEYMGIVRNATIAQHDLMIEQRKNQLLIEQNLTLQKEIDKYVNWKSAREIKLEFKLPARPGIEKVAMLLNLKENEDWIARFYDDTHLYKKILYSPEAVERIVEYIKDLH